MNGNIERNKLRQENLKIFTDISKELIDIDEENSAIKPENSVWTIDTSSFLTLICC